MLSLLEVPSYPFETETETFSDVDKNCGNYIDLKIESAEKYVSCGLDIKFTEEYFDVPKILDENLKPMTTEGVLNVWHHFLFHALLAHELFWTLFNQPAITNNML